MHSEVCFTQVITSFMLRRQNFYKTCLYFFHYFLSLYSKFYINLKGLSADFLKMVYLCNRKGYFKKIKRKICGPICNLAIIIFNKLVF